MATGNKFQKPVHRVDPLLKELDPGYLQLSVLLWQDGLSFSVLHPENNDLLAEVEHPFFSGEHLREALHRIWASDQLLQLPYGQVTGAWEAIRFTLLPEVLSSEETAGEFLKLEFGSTEDPVTLQRIDPDLNIAYSVPQAVQNWWNEHFPGAPLHCLWSRWYQAVRTTADHVHVLAEPGRVGLLVTGKNHPELLQRYAAETSEDVAYYLLFALEQLGIDPKKTTVALTGELAEDNRLRKLLSGYVSKIREPETDRLLKKTRSASWLLHTQHLCASSAAD